MPDSEQISVKEVISEKEEKFEKHRKSIGLFLGPLFFVLMLFIPVAGLNPKAHTLAAVMLWIIVWWVTEPIPIPATALVGIVLCSVTGVAEIKIILQPFADPLIFLFLGSFILAKAMSIHNLDKRFSYGIMSLKFVKNSSARILFAFGAIAAFISMWISNTATTAMMFPIGIGIVNSMAEIISKNTGKPVDARTLRFGTGMMLMAAYASSAGGIGTPVGTPPNLIGIGLIEKFTGVKISFVQWMSFSLPILVVMYFALFAIMYFLHKPEINHIKGTVDFIKAERVKLGKWTRGQKNSLIGFLIAVTLWIMPGFIGLIYGGNSAELKAYNSFIPETVGALAGAMFLFLLPVNWKEKKFTIGWNDAVKIDWGTLLLFGSGLSLGTLMYDTKLAEYIGKFMVNFGNVESVWGITFAAIFISIFVSEATSNTASANMIVPVLIAICLSAGINPLPPAIGATLGSSWGFMLPVSTAPNAIVYGSGMVPITKMVRAGIFFDIAGGLIIWLGLRLLLPLVGLS